MITETIREFLQKPLIARMTTIGPDGYPHTVPVWFMLDGDTLAIISVRGTRKVEHIQANPRGAVCIGGDTGDGGGYLFKGTFSIAEDSDNGWMKKLVHRYETPEQAEKDIAEWTPLDIVVLRLTPHSVAKVA